MPAPEIETLVLDGVRKHGASIGEAEHPTPVDDRDLIERLVDRIVVKPEAIEVRLLVSSDERVATGGDDHGLKDGDRIDHPLPALVLPWAARSFCAVKGILHSPGAAPALKPKTRDAVLGVIAKARAWIDDLVEHRVASFAEIAAREGKAERHIGRIEEGRISGSS